MTNFAKGRMSPPMALVRAQKYSLSTVTQPTATSGLNSSQETNPAKATRKGRNKCLVLIIIVY